MKETLTNPIYLAFRKFCLKKDKLCDLMTNDSWRQNTTLGLILPVTTSRASLSDTLKKRSGCVN